MRFEYWLAHGDGWHWRAKARNGVIVAGSVDSFTREEDVQRAIRQLIRAVRWGAPAMSKVDRPR